MKIGQSAGKTWEYLVGVYLGDGCVTADKGYLVFRLNTIDEDFAAATKEVLHHHTTHTVNICCHPVSKSSKPNYSLRCGDPRLGQKLRDETNNKVKLPDWIWEADHDGLLAFIAGLMDSEGYVTRNAHGSAYMGFKSTDEWFSDFLRVLNKAGIQYGKVGVEKPRKPGYRTPRRITIKLRSWVDSGAYFKIARKQSRIEEWAAQVTSETNMRRAA